MRLLGLTASLFLALTAIASATEVGPERGRLVVGGGGRNIDPILERFEVGGEGYARLPAPDRRVYVVGDQQSTLPGCRKARFP